MYPVTIKNDISWIGAVDYNSRDFHGYSLSPLGTSYNAFLLLDEKNVIFDSVKAEYAGAMIQRLRCAVNPEKIDYLVVNHVEMDHSGALPELVGLCKPEKIFCSVMGQKALEGHFDTAGWPIQAMKSGDSISTGKRTIHFLETRMLHWPDSMVSYIPEEKLLISNDAFGQNIASSERFADEADHAVLAQAVKEYYHNIVQPYAPQVIKTLDLIGELKLDIRMIAPDHGLIFRNKKDIDFILRTYRHFAEQPWKQRALIAYDSMWQSTETMARYVAEGLVASGVPCSLFNMKRNHHSAVMTALADCGAILVASPTHNNGMLPAIAGLLAYMKGLRPKNKIGAAFGSFGWSGEGPQQIHDHLAHMGFAMPLAPVKCRFVPGRDALDQCFALGEGIAGELIARCR